VTDLLLHLERDAELDRLRAEVQRMRRAVLLLYNCVDGKQALTEDVARTVRELLTPLTTGKVS